MKLSLATVATPCLKRYPEAAIRAKLAGEPVEIKVIVDPAQDCPRVVEFEAWGTPTPGGAVILNNLLLGLDPVE